MCAAVQLGDLVGELRASVVGEEIFLSVFVSSKYKS